MCVSVSVCVGVCDSIISFFLLPCFGMEKTITKSAVAAID